MGVITHGGILPDSSQKTDFYAIVDNATVSSIIDADISSGASIQDSKLNTISTAGKVNVTALTGQIANANLAQLVTPALVSGAALTLLPNIPSGAGVIPSANIGNLLGTWATKSVNQIYQAATDLFVTYSQNGSSPQANILTDSSSSPSTDRCYMNFSSGTLSVCCFVKKNDYYEIVSTGGASVTYGPYIIPIGS